MPDIQQDLAPLLTSGAAVHLPGSQKYAVCAERWAQWNRPTFSAIVEVAAETDVQETVKYANSRSIPFLAISGAHGCFAALAGVQDGIGIWMRRLNSATLAENGESATVGGGIVSGEFTSALWAMGKQTVSGVCESTGVVAPMLGGGHGWLQGQYGLLCDQLLSARLVLANGSAITVSNDEHADLFWALKGAGHNFGIVTSFEYKVYDVTDENKYWTVDTMAFTQDKLESVYEYTNSVIGRDVKLTTWGFWLHLPQIDPDHLVILYSAIYQGESIPDQYLQPLKALDPVPISQETVGLPGLAKATNMHYESRSNQKGGPTVLRSPIDLEKYHIPSLRKAYDWLDNAPDSFRETLIMICEGYAMHGVQRVPAETTAVPYRHKNLLLSPCVAYQHDPARSELTEQAEGIARKVQELLAEGSEEPMLAYVNYTLGEDGNKAWYGHESWRLEKLKGLKSKYDPNGRFSFYAPIR